MARKKYILLLISIILLTPVIFSQENLLINGDFEDIQDDSPTNWQVDAWKPNESATQVYIDSDYPISGDYYITIENIENNDARIIQEVDVKPSTEYKLSCWIKADIKDTSRNGAFLLASYDEDDQKSSEYFDTQGNWEYCEVFVHTQKKQKTMTVAARLGYYNGDVQGTASFDDFQLEEIGPVDVAIYSDPDIPAIAAFGLIFLGIIILSFGVVFLIQKKQPGLLKNILNDPYQKPLQGVDLWKQKKDGLNKTDWLIMGILVLVYSLISFPNLGSMKAPQTGWLSSMRGESCYVDFGETKEIKRIALWEGLPRNPTEHGKYLIEYSKDARNWQQGPEIAAETMSYWYFHDINFRARYVKLTVVLSGTILNEVVFIGADRETPLEIKDIEVINRLPTRYGKMENIFDEAHTLVKRPDHLNGMSPGFDEQYHARTAFEHIHFINHYETTHPPLGKLFIALGVIIFGMTPFGWRFAGNFFGILMVPLSYLLGKEIFKKREYGIMSAVIMAFDFMHFTQSRIATIDTYGVFFIMLMFYFMMQYYNLEFFKVPFYKTLIPLLLSGIACGLGAASKWTVIYAFLGLALFFFISLVKRFREKREYTEIYNSKDMRKLETDRDVLGQRLKGFNKAIIITLALCLVFFILIPGLLYFFSYTPIMMVDKVGNEFSFDFVWSRQVHMYEYHARTKEEHGYSSSWNEWPLILKPMWYFNGENLQPHENQRLWAMGSPAVWWIGSFAGLALIILVIFNAIKNIQSGHYEKRRRDPAAMVIIIGICTTYLPWIVSARTLTFIYHFFPVVPFIILAIVYFIRYSREQLAPWFETHKSKLYPGYLTAQGTIILTYFITLIVLFFMFYPILSGTITTKAYVKQFIEWLPRWFFS